MEPPAADDLKRWRDVTARWGDVTLVSQVTAAGLGQVKLAALPAAGDVTAL